MPLPLLLLLAAAAQPEDGPPPRPLNPEGWISQNDYPAAALRAGQEGTAGYRVGVGADGRVTDCAITSSSGSAELDSATCRLLAERARFQPARNRRGRKLPSFYQGRINWRMGAPELPAPGLMATTVELSSDHKVGRCTTEAQGGVPEAVKAASCERVTSNPPVAMLRQLGARFASLTYVTGMSIPEQPIVLDRTRWGTMIGRRVAEVRFGADKKPLSCEPTFTAGPGPQICANFPAVAAPEGTVAAPVAHVRLVEVALYGVPR